MQKYHVMKFPEVCSADEQGIVAIGGSFDPEYLISAYLQGIFPWPVAPDAPITWFAPDPRGIIDLKNFALSKSQKKILRSAQNSCWKVQFNTHFEEIMHNCASAPYRQELSGGWITRDLMKGYVELFHLGYAYSVAVMSSDQELVGGLYGVCLGDFISGESMFYKKSNASKVALVTLLLLLQEKKIPWIDTQMITPLTEQFQGKYIPRAEFMERLNGIDFSRSREDIFGS